MKNKPMAVYMPDYIKERCDLAHTYAEDGAYVSAARILRELAKAVSNHAKACFEFEGLMKK